MAWRAVETRLCTLDGVAGVWNPTLHARSLDGVAGIKNPTFQQALVFAPAQDRPHDPEIWRQTRWPLAQWINTRGMRGCPSIPKLYVTQTGSKVGMSGDRSRLPAMCCSQKWLLSQKYALRSGRARSNGKSTGTGTEANLQYMYWKYLITHFLKCTGNGYWNPSLL